MVFTQVQNQDIKWPLEACLAMAKHSDAGFAEESWEDVKQAICEVKCNWICM